MLNFLNVDLRMNDAGGLAIGGQRGHRSPASLPPWENSDEVYILLYIIFSTFNLDTIPKSIFFEFVSHLRVTVIIGRDEVGGNMIELWMLESLNLF